MQYFGFSFFGAAGHKIWNRAGQYSWVGACEWLRSVAYICVAKQ